MAEMGGGELDAGTLILPILERITDPKINRQQIDTQVELNRTLLQLIKTFEGFSATYKGAGGSGRFPTNKNPLQPQAPSTLMNALSWMGEKKDKAVEFIKKGFFKLFKTDYFGNLLKSIGALAKAIGNTFMNWLKFFIMMAFIDPSGGFMRDIINLFTQIGMIVFKTVMPLIPVAVKMMFDTIIYVFKLVLKLMPEIISTIMQTFTQLGNTFPILKPIIGFINQFLGALRSLFVILNDPKADKGGAFQSFLKKVFRILGMLLEKVIDYAVEKLPIVIGFVFDFIQNTLIPAFVKYVPIILDELSKAIDVLITKYPNLKVWIQPFKDILDMISAFIGSFASFNSTEYIQGLDEYKKKEKELFAQKQYQSATEEQRMKMLSDMQYGFIVDNKDIIKKAQEDFNKLNEDKLNLAKDKWDDFISHALDTLGAAYDKLPTEAKVGVGIFAISKLYDWYEKFTNFVSDNLALLLVFGKYISKLGLLFTAIGEALMFYVVTPIVSFITGLSAMTVGIVIAVLAIIGLIWYFWDDISKFFSDAWDSFVQWWDTVDIMGPLKNVGLMIIGFFGDMIDAFYDEFISPFEGLWDDFVGLFKNIELPDWLTSWTKGMGGGTDASELSNSNNALKNQQNQMIKNGIEVDKKIADKRLKASIDPNKIKKENDAILRANERVGTYNKTAESIQRGLNDTLAKNPIKPIVTTETVAKINVPASSFSFTELKSVRLEWLDNFFLTLRIGFDKFMNWVMNLKGISLAQTDKDKLRTKMYKEGRLKDTKTEFANLQLLDKLSAEEAKFLYGISEKKTETLSETELTQFLRLFSTSIKELGVDLKTAYKGVDVDKVIVTLLKRPDIQTKLGVPRN